MSALPTLYCYQSRGQTCANHYNEAYHIGKGETYEILRTGMDVE